MINGGYTHAAPMERSALKRGAAGRSAPSVGWGSSGEGLRLASGPHSTVGAASVSPRNLVGPQPWFSMARTCSGSDTSFQGCAPSLTSEVEDGEVGEPKVPPVCPLLLWEVHAGSTEDGTGDLRTNSCALNISLTNLLEMQGRSPKYILQPLRV